MMVFASFVVGLCANVAATAVLVCFRGRGSIVVMDDGPMMVVLKLLPRDDEGQSFSMMMVG